MKKQLQILFLITLVIQFHALGETRSGLYMSLSDYQNNRPTYLNSCSGGKTKLHVHDFFWNRSTIKVIDCGHKISYKKSELYGFIDDDNNLYRFYKNAEYRIAEADNIYIYVQQNNIAQSKGFTVVNTFYFSTTPGGAIMRLTLHNLRNAYISNEKFIALLDQFFSDGDVSQYDDLHKTYKINYMFRKAMNE